MAQFTVAQISTTGKYFAYSLSFGNRFESVFFGRKLNAEEKGDFTENSAKTRRGILWIVKNKKYKNSIWRYKEIALKYFSAEEAKNNGALKYYIEEAAKQFREKTRPADDLELFEKLMKIFKENI